MQPGMSRTMTGGASGLNIAREYEQLKIEYETMMEKLNQTMNSIKTFWSPELKVRTEIICLISMFMASDQTDRHLKFGILLNIFVCFVERKTTAS